jgi:oligopeptide transport system substrate-binding protein
MLIFLGCSKEKEVKKSLAISLTGEISTLDPANCYDAVCLVPVTQVYETLFEMEYLKRPYTLKPLMAKTFPAISKNRLTYTFKIKPGIPYHPSSFIPQGRIVKAADFINSFKRVAFIPTRSTGWWLFDGKIKGLNEWRNKVGSDLSAFYTNSIEGLKAIDDETLQIELNRPFPQLLYILSMTFTSPIPEEIIRKTNNDLSENFAGTGAYFIKKFNLAQGASLKKFSNYTTSVYPTQGDRYSNENNLLRDAGKKLPFIEDVDLVVIKEAQTDWLNFLKQKIDLINLTKDHYHVALTPEGKLKPELIEENIQVQVSPTLIYWWIQFNMKDPLLGKNLNLRNAIAHAVNIDKYLELFTYNIGQKANSIFPPGIPGYSPSRDLPYSYDLVKAKEYLAKAGYPEGKGLPTFIFSIRGTDTRKRQMGEFIQKELQAIGINTQIQINTFPAFLDKSRKGELQLWQGGWVMDYPDAENVLQLLYSENHPPGPNSSHYKNTEYDKLFEKVKYLEDGEEKFVLMRKMEDLVNQDLPWVMQYYSRNYILYHDYLQNFRYSDIIYNSIKYLKIKNQK